MYTFKEGMHKKMTKALRSIYRGGHSIYVAGNGGSASLANHFVCDLAKGPRNEPNVKCALRIHSLTSNMPFMTAIANDMEYENTILYQLEIYAKVNDMVILISCSGESQNIVKAANYCHEKGIMLVGMTAFFRDNTLDRLADIKFHVDSFNYGLAENKHTEIMHKICNNYFRSFDAV